MTQKDGATLVLGAGNFYTAATGTAIPADLTVAPPVAWTSVGHTDLDDVFKVGSDGGDTTVLKTLQNRSLRTVRSAREDTFTLIVKQFDTPTLKLYHGSNATVNADGSVGVPVTPTPTVAAFLAIFTDPTNANTTFAFYAPKSEILRSDDIDIKDVESLAGLPLGIKPLISGTNTWAYAVTPLTGS